MTTCGNFKITLKNSCDGEVKAKKFEYKDGSNWKVENMFGPDGIQKIEKDHAISFTRDLGGIGNENTQFRVTYSHHGGGTVWGEDICETTEVFLAQDKEGKTVTLTR